MFFDIRNSFKNEFRNLILFIFCKIIDTKIFIIVEINFIIYSTFSHLTYLFAIFCYFFGYN